MQALKSLTCMIFGHRPAKHRWDDTPFDHKLHILYCPRCGGLQILND